jgi:hypothetical protein
MTTPRDLTTPELRPCPFCGVVPEKVSGAGYVWCSTRACPGAGDIIEHDRWNRRPRTFTAAEVAEAMRGWGDAYAAFVGAFDTPAARRKQSDEYANDARDRLRDFHERITHWLRENELERTP